MQERLLLLVFGLVLLSACTKSPQNQNVLAAAKGGGDAEAAHGGDPLDLALRSTRANFGKAVLNIKN